MSSWITPAVITPAVLFAITSNTIPDVLAKNIDGTDLKHGASSLTDFTTSILQNTLILVIQLLH